MSLIRDMSRYPKRRILSKKLEPTVSLDPRRAAVIASTAASRTSHPPSSHRLSRKRLAVRKSSALFWASLGVCLAVVRPCGSDEKRPVRVYTNEDLDRVHPYRDQTGVESKPAYATTGTERAGTPRQELGGGGATARRKRRSAEGDEEQWRRSAEKLREKLRPLRERADDLREKIEERRRQPGVRPYTDPRIVADQRRLEVLERRIREAESNFEDRARRLGVLPGWLR
jgi:hypothetical protein